MLHHLQAVSVHAYYCGLHNAGRAACERILRIADVPPEVEQLTRTNRTWYTRTLPDLVPPTVSRRLGEELPTRDGWAWFNPSVFATDAGWLVALRQSNYRIADDGTYQMAGGDPCVRTETTLCWYTPDWQLVDHWELPIAYDHNGHRIVGLEDVRLNQLHDGTIVASGSVLDHGQHDGLARIGTVVLDLTNRTCGPLVVRDVPGRRSHEKNWMPVVGAPLWVYHPHAGGRVEVASPEDSSTWSVAALGESPPIARGFRGGGQVVPLADNRSLAIVHEVADAGEPRAGQRVYEHRFVEFDVRTWDITRVSLPFALQSPRQIEFAAGLARRGDSLAITYGVRDASAWVLEVPLDGALSLLGACR
ncbi:MAG: hypothetical protein EBR82_54710 [Caulobacteraceae bacterium]|nr:hypothetical protein [Caulobacteraceae bacterium]